MDTDYYSNSDEIKILKKEKQNIEKEIKKAAYMIDVEKKDIKSKRKRIKEIESKIEILKKNN